MRGGVLRPELLARSVSHRALMRPFDWPRSVSMETRKILTHSWEAYGGPVVFDREIGTTMRVASGCEEDGGTVAVEAVFAPTPGPYDIADEMRRCGAWGRDELLPIAASSGGHRFVSRPNDPRLYLWLSDLQGGAEDLFLCADDLGAFIAGLRPKENQPSAMRPIAAVDRGLDALFAASRKPVN